MESKPWYTLHPVTVDEDWSITLMKVSGNKFYGVMNPNFTS